MPLQECDILSAWTLLSTEANELHAGPRRFKWWHFLFRWRVAFLSWNFLAYRSARSEKRWQAIVPTSSFRENLMEIRFAVVFGVEILSLACGENESVDGGAAEESTAGLERLSRSCLHLIEQERFTAALPICVSALEHNPDSQRIQQAVERARAETGR